ncbi:DUF1579 domain-containing protein [Archangium lipolyticum]|uniref:DUF1579 domain-containing protein n=1 Tax=Archangium lipolyticum TaxID=2970465 RepID=UPI00214A55D7|nr:DUF1579 domain-containing protein [Archangium lipolyticum]
MDTSRKTALATDSRIDPQAERFMEETVSHSQPSSPHALLASWAGTWKVRTRNWMGTWVESTATVKMRMTLGGRYLEETYTSTVLGHSFEGRTIFGYDNTQDVFVMMTYGSMGTGLTLREGTLDASGRVITFRNATGGSERVEIRMEGPHELVAEMFDGEPGHDEVKVVEARYTRARSVWGRGF